MTHDERIEAMARAICEQFYGTSWELTSHFRQQICIGLADKALDAAGVEEMVREAAREAWDLGCMSETSDIEQRNQDAEEIVREVMGK
jgi:hypothetical protein